MKNSTASIAALLTLLIIIASFCLSDLAGLIVSCFVVGIIIAWALHKIFNYLYKKAGLDD